MQCKYCSGEIPHNAKVCPYCGREAHEKEKIFVDRPVMVYENEPEPDGLEYRKAKEIVYRYSAICFVFSLMSIAFGVISIVNNLFLLLFIQIILCLVSIGIALMTLSVCKQQKVKKSPILWMTIILDVLSIVILFISILK